MSMQEIRALVAERSVMIIYSSGETVEVPELSIGFLLEGFLKAQDNKADLITSPTALLPSCRDLCFLDSETSGIKPALFSHRGSWYRVETRARIIIFDIAAFEAYRPLKRRSSSVDHPSTSREHAGLMRWPGLVHKPKQHHHNVDNTDQQRNNFSARAMQLSIFGSVVNETQLHHLSSPVDSYHTATATDELNMVSLTGKKLQAYDFARQDPASYYPSTSRIDETGAADEHIVCIDSPSRLSFRHTS